VTVFPPFFAGTTAVTALAAEAAPAAFCARTITRSVEPASPLPTT
jgi:hypothetical protein